MAINESIENVIDSYNKPFKMAPYLQGILFIGVLEIITWLPSVEQRRFLGLFFIGFDFAVGCCFYIIYKHFGHERYFRCLCNSLVLAAFSVVLFCLSYRIIVYELSRGWPFLILMMIMYILGSVINRYIVEWQLRKNKVDKYDEAKTRAAGLTGALIGNVAIRILAKVVKINTLMPLAGICYFIALMLEMICFYNFRAFILFKQHLENRQICIDMVEGKMSFEDFYDNVLKSADIEAWISYYLRKSRGENAALENLACERIRQGDWQNTIRGRYNLQKDIKNLLMNSFPDVTVIPDKKVSKIYWLALKSCPNQIDNCEERQQIEEIILECEEEWSDSQKVRYVKNRVREELECS